jgi:hypothetical protein
MSITVTRNARSRGLDHFEPELDQPPQEMRKLKGHLDQIDYAAFHANQQAIGKLPPLDLALFEKLAAIVAQSRARWAAASLEIAVRGGAPQPEQMARLAQMRADYEELTEAYEGLRRLVERGYVTFKAKA